MDILRQKTIITPEDQKAYFEEKVFPEYEKTQPDMLLYGILKNDDLIGYGGLVHIDWIVGSAEISFLLEPVANSDVQIFCEIFEAFLKFIKGVAFKIFPLNKIYTSAYDIRPHLYISLERQGFSLEARILKSVRVGDELVDEVKHCFFMSQYVDKERFNVLVTSISSKVPLLREVRNACRKFDPLAKIHGCDSNEDVIARYFVDEFWHVNTSELTVDYIVGYCVDNDIRLIIPTRDGELKFWASIKTELKTYGIVVLVSNIQSIVTCLDKKLFSDFCEQSEINAIASFELPDNKHSLWVVKERFGAGSDKILLGLSAEDAIKAKDKFDAPIFQPMHTGLEVSVDAFINQRGELHGLIIRKRSMVIKGESQVTEIIDDSKLADDFKLMISKFKFYGPIVIQAFINDNQATLIECNPRFGGASTLSISAGLDMFYWSLKEVNGELEDCDSFKRNASVNKQVRYKQDLIL